MSAAGMRGGVLNCSLFTNQSLFVFWVSREKASVFWWDNLSRLYVGKAEKWEVSQSRKLSGTWPFFQWSIIKKEAFFHRKLRACWGFGFRGKSRQFFDETRRKNGSIAIPKWPFFQRSIIKKGAVFHRKLNPQQALKRKQAFLACQLRKKGLDN